VHLAVVQVRDCKAQPGVLHKGIYR
jgi:hypothetical protein